MDYLRQDSDNLIEFSIVVAWSGSSIELEKTINFLVKTGMPRNIRESILLCTYSGNIYPENNKQYSRLDVGLEHIFERNTFCESLKTCFEYSSLPYVLFLTAGSKVSWGSIDALYRAARERPDAAAFGPVLRSSAGRIILPPWSRKRFAFLHYFFMHFITRPADVEPVSKLFSDAFLVRGDALSAMNSQLSPYDQNQFFKELMRFGDVLYVSAAQLLSLSLDGPKR